MRIRVAHAAGATHCAIFAWRLNAVGRVFTHILPQWKRTSDLDEHGQGVQSNIMLGDKGHGQRVHGESVEGVLQCISSVSAKGVQKRNSNRRIPIDGKPWKAPIVQSEMSNLVGKDQNFLHKIRETNRDNCRKRISRSVTTDSVNIYIYLYMFLCLDTTAYRQEG